MRGYDYRCPNSTPVQSVVLIIGSPFVDKRDRIQGLMRVGRHGDLCYRIQAKGVKEVDNLKNAERKGNLSKAITQVKEELNE